MSSLPIPVLQFDNIVNLDLLNVKMVRSVLGSIFLLVTLFGLVHSQDGLQDFRMQRVNLMWKKAQKSAMGESKLLQLKQDLAQQDKEELALKKLKSEGGDKTGSREADVRKRFVAILRRYDLLDAWPDKDLDKDVRRGQGREDVGEVIFKDKRLAQLWSKALKAGFDEDELGALKVEFAHHQEEVDLYHTMLEQDRLERERRHNHLEQYDESFVNSDSNELIGKRASLKSEYERLHRLATRTMDDNSQQWRHPKTEALWKLAEASDFTTDELDSLRNELRHFEAKMDKLHHLQEELDNRHEDKSGSYTNIFDKKLAKQADKIAQLQKDLELKIAVRHSEL